MVKVTATSSFNKSVLDRIRAAAKYATVEVGYPDDAVYPNGEKVIEVARAQEFGTGRIPPRPFVRPTISKQSGHWYSKLKDGIIHATTPEQIQAVYADLGKEIQDNLRQEIDRVTDPPLSEATISRRKAHGNDSTKPLVDTGRMRDSISFRVGAEGAWQK